MNGPVDCNTELLRQLHWLPIKWQIRFKFAIVSIQSITHS